MQTYSIVFLLLGWDNFLINLFVSVCQDNPKWIYETQKKMYPNLIIWELRWCKLTIVENIATLVKFFDCGLYWMVTDWNQILNIHFLFLAICFCNLIYLYKFIIILMTVLINHGQYVSRFCSVLSWNVLKSIKYKDIFASIFCTICIKKIHLIFIKIEFVTDRFNWVFYCKNISNF